MTTDLVSELLRARAKDALARLETITPEELLAPAKVVSRDDAMLVKAALYLRHGALDACHKIVQQVESSNGSYWHAILHRKECDFDNAKYWYRQAGQGHPMPAKMGADWDPAAFVDMCARDAGVESSQLAQQEFALMLTHTIRCATGVAS